MPECTNDVGCSCWGCIKASTEYPSVCGIHAEDSEWVPAESSSNLCRDCREELGRNLRRIETYWPAVEDALARGRGGGDSERMGGSDVHPPLPINANASDAMRVARDAVWSGVDQLIMDKPGVRAPDDQSTPNLSGWLDCWHLSHLAAHPNGSWTVEWYTEIQRAAEAMEKASLEGNPETPLDMQCRKIILTERGLPEQCSGMVTSVPKGDGSPGMVRCSEDAGHEVPWDDWVKVHRGSRAKTTAALSKKAGIMRAK